MKQINNLIDMPIKNLFDLVSLCNWEHILSLSLSMLNCHQIEEINVLNDSINIYIHKC